MEKRVKTRKQTQPSISLRRRNLNQKGQLVIEYILLLMVVTLMATMLTRLLIGQAGPDGDKGLIIQKWQMIVDTISLDIIDREL